MIVRVQEAWRETRGGVIKDIGWKSSFSLPLKVTFVTFTNTDIDSTSN